MEQWSRPGGETDNQLPLPKQLPWSVVGVSGVWSRHLPSVSGLDDIPGRGAACVGKLRPLGRPKPHC